METTPLKPLELTPELLNSAKKMAMSIAKKYCPKNVDFDEVAQQAWLHLYQRPPLFDPSRGAKPTTLLYLVIKRAVFKYLKREKRISDQHVSLQDRAESDVDRGARQPDSPERSTKENRGSSGYTGENLFDFVTCPETQNMLRILMECDCNVSKAARRLGIVEGTIRSRIKRLKRRLLQAGFKPFAKEFYDNSD